MTTSNIKKNYLFCSGSQWQHPSQSNTNTRRRIATRRDLNKNQSSPADTKSEEEQCEICFEDTTRVQLYPCKHSDICVTCVTKILTTVKRECPFCRRRIDGYIDLASGHRFG